jgi:hypothetical protein
MSVGGDFANSANGMVRPCSGPASTRSWQGGAQDKEHALSQKLNAAIAVIGIDIGKNSFHIVGHDHHGAIVLRQKWSRGQVETRFANLPPCLIGMEACVGAHHRRDSGACPDTRRFNTLYEIRCSTLLVSPESSCLCRLNSIEPPWYGPVRPVVWEGWRRETSPYPDLWHLSDMAFVLNDVRSSWRSQTLRTPQASMPE